MDMSALCVLTVSPFICMTISPLIREINYIKIKECACTNVAKGDGSSCSTGTIHLTHEIEREIKGKSLSILSCFSCAKLIYMCV